MLVQVGIALGSNLGDRYSELNAGIAYLKSLSIINEVRESSRINTAPVNCPPGSKEFLNSVAEIDVDQRDLCLRPRFQGFLAIRRDRGDAIARIFQDAGDVAGDKDFVFDYQH